MAEEGKNVQRTPWQESQAIRPPPSVAARLGKPQAFPMGAYDPNTRQFAADPGMAGMRERAATAAFASRPESGVEYADYEGAGGWGYRLYDDGTIKIIKAPEGHKAGAKLDAGPAYDAIWSEISANEPSFATPNAPRAGGVHEAMPTPEPPSPSVAGGAGEALLDQPVAAAREQVAPGADILRKLRGIG